MVIEIDLKELKNLNLTLNQLVYINILQNKKKLTKSINIDRIISKEEVEDLLTRKFIQCDNTDNKIDAIVSKDFITLIRGKQIDYFEEFREWFPTTVERPDGSKDYLRTHSVMCKNIYNNLVKNNQSTHEHLLKCLKTEISSRLASNKLSYMKRMINWLRSEEWKVFESVIEEEQKKPKIKTYGTDIE